MSAGEQHAIVHDKHTRIDVEADDDDDDDDCDWSDNEFSDEETTVEPIRKSVVYENPHEMVEQIERSTRKRKKLVEEIVSTEVTYVNKLYLLNKTAWEIEGANLANEMFQVSVIHQMFPGLEALYRLHGENILPAFKVCLEEWSTSSQLAPLWKKYLPFLTMYKSYTSQYDGALDVINQQKKQSPEFAVLLAKIESKSEFGKLTLEHHLVEPVQRIARYRLLMQNYCKLLRPEEEETKTAASVIDSMDQLLKACQSGLKKKDIFGDLCKLQEKFDETLSMLNPTARLVKEGSAYEITGATNKKKVHRHLFLFTDLILVCSKRPTGKFRISFQLELHHLKVRPVDPACALAYGTATTMLLISSPLTVTLMFKDMSVKEAWEDAILDTIAVKMAEKQLRRDGSTDLHVSMSLKSKRGGNDSPFMHAPDWLADDRVTSCMLCDAPFVSARRKHHCRGCGRIVCSSCARQKMALPSMNGEVCHVCNKCFILARKRAPDLTRASTLKRQTWTPMIPKFTR